MATKEITMAQTVKGNSKPETCAPAQRSFDLAGVNASALFDWGLGLGAALCSSHLPAGPRRFDRSGRPPST